MVTSYQDLDKADMFSVGVVLFEMCHPPFTTGMVRKTSRYLI